MNRRNTPLVALALGLGLVVWMVSITQQGDIAVSSVEGASWRRPDEWFNPKLVRWMGVPLTQNHVYSEVRVHDGDDPRWSAPDWDDRTWRSVGFFGLPRPAGIVWARFRVRSENGELPLGVLVSGLWAYEIYWDGEMIGRSGVPGASAATEQPGPLDNVFGLSRSQAAAGEHVVALRMSNYRNGFRGARAGIMAFLQTPTERQVAYAQRAVFPALAAGAMFILSIVAFLLWVLAARRPAFWLFGVLCLLAAMMQATQGARWFLNYSYEWHDEVIRLSVVLTALLGVCVTSLVVVHFVVPGRWFIISAVAIGMGLLGWIGPRDTNLATAEMMIGSLGVSCLCAGWSALHRQRRAWLVAVGLLASAALAAWRPYYYVNAEFFVRFLPAVLGLTAMLAWQVRDELRGARQTVLRAARLEIELLKKNIQPHFLMNTLTSLLEVVEQDARSAGKMIEALANEFRILSHIAGQRLVPLSEELELCQAHLRIMSLQRNRTFVLETENTVYAALVPPALFHTLIENGITHQIMTESRPVFRLRAEQRDNLTAYEFTAPGEPEPNSSCDERNGGDGTGMRYVKARLEESFPGGWSLQSGPVANGQGWRTHIELRVSSAVLLT